MPTDKTLFIGLLSARRGSGPRRTEIRSVEVDGQPMRASAATSELRRLEARTIKRPESLSSFAQLLPPFELNSLGFVYF